MENKEIKEQEQTVENAPVETAKPAEVETPKDNADKEAEPKAEEGEKPAAPLAPRIALVERFKKLYPEDDFENDDVFFGHIQKDMDEYDKNNEYYAQLYAKLYDDPKAAAILSAIADGEPIEVAISKYIDPEKDLPRDGDENYDKYREARDARVKAYEDSENRKKEIEKNVTESEKLLLAWGEKNGMDAEQTKKWFDESVTSFFEKMGQGIVDESMLDAFLKGGKYDVDIEEARKAGEVAGRNQRIEEKEADETGDGMPSGRPQGSDTPEKPHKKTYNPFLAGGGMEEA